MHIINYKKKAGLDLKQINKTYNVSVMQEQIFFIWEGDLFKKGRNSYSY